MQTQPAPKPARLIIQARRDPDATTWHDISEVVSTDDATYDIRANRALGWPKYRIIAPEDTS